MISDHPRQREATMSEIDEVEALQRRANEIYARAKRLVFDQVPPADLDHAVLSIEQRRVLAELDAIERQILDYWAAHQGRRRPRLPRQWRGTHDEPRAAGSRRPPTDPDAG